MAWRVLLLSCLMVVVSGVGVIVAQDPTTAADVTLAPPVSCTKVNEKYDWCGPACGDLTCSNYRRSDFKCTRMCVEGCFCEGGYVRSRGGSCVPLYTCAGRR